MDYARQNSMTGKLQDWLQRIRTQTKNYRELNELELQDRNKGEGNGIPGAPTATW